MAKDKENGPTAIGSRVQGSLGLADLLIRDFRLSSPGHEGTREGAWYCGGCGYGNIGAICTKCGGYPGAARWWQR